ncbi:putative ubiquitin carboxyl-terminal hydrolase 3 [Colletotrichum trifolii]|uniref:ubiquitinyl hydrolase 1 n=1 Tax=Colletotrichum trifolii TaxID=5466 RepID=A0A4R8RNX5_COLTR|nr:putative ubiquitin carboxyl-terminal hydrolase 3 [Colletotrichum trifolii]
MGPSAVQGGVAREVIKTMESWSPESRSAVQDAFNALRETISREAQHEVDQRLKADALSRSLLNDELEILRSRSENVDRLEQENRRLRSLLSEYHQRGRVTEPAKETTTPRARMCDRATNTDVEPRQQSQVPDVRQLRDAQRAVQKFNALDKNYKILRQHYKEKLRDANEKWEKYADSLQAKLERFEEQNGRAADHLFRDRPRAASAAVGRGAVSFGSDPGEEPPAEGDPQRWTDPHVSAYPAPPDTEMSTTDFTKGETTGGSTDADLPPLPPSGPNLETPLVLKLEPSSDGPVFVSERHVGKRKLPSETSRGGPEARRIKIESSSLSASLPNTQLQPESMDLDDVGQRLSTPRKNRHRDGERATTEPSYVRPDSVTTPASRTPHASVVLTPVDPNVRSARAYEKIIEKPLQKGLARGISAVAEDGQIYEANAPGGQLGAQFRTPQPPGHLQFSDSSNRGPSLQIHDPQAGRMNSRHLPAGQAMPGGSGPGPAAGVDMGGGPGGGNRRRVQQHSSYAPYHQQYHQHIPMYPTGYMNPYAPTPPFYHHPPPQPYQNPAMTSGYMHYPPQQQQQQQPYPRSAQVMPPYVPMSGVSVTQPYSQPPQQSPALATPYQPPPIPASMPVQSPPTSQPQLLHHTPQSSVISPVAEPFQPITEPLKAMAEPFQPSAPASVASQTLQTPQTPQVPQSQELSVAKGNFRAPLPWVPPGQGPMARRAAKSRPRRRFLSGNSQNITLPVEQHEGAVEAAAESNKIAQAESQEAGNEAESTVPKGTPSKNVFWSSKDADSESLLPGADSATSEAPRNGDGSASSVSNVSSPEVATSDGFKDTARPTTSSSNTSRPAIPIVPVVPVIPKNSPKETKPATIGAHVESKESAISETKPVGESQASDMPSIEQEKAAAEPQAPVKPAPPKTWSGLFAGRTAAAPKTSATGNEPAVTTPINGATANGGVAANGAIVNLSMGSADSLASAMRDFRVGGLPKFQFIEPRGLINTGNMCYMNSVLQVLLFCVPFYDFLDHVSKKAAHKFKSETPVTDAMMMFMAAFRVIDSTTTVEKLRKKLRNEQLEQYGDSFRPDFVYRAIEPLPAFANMRQGHQQDAEEFLGFLLNAMDEECTRVMSSIASVDGSSDTRPTSSASAADTTDGADGWYEVGSKQRAIETRSSADTKTTPITRLFGGLMRSEVKRPGAKDFATFESFQSLQLDISQSNINNVVDAIRNHTLPEKVNDALPTTKQFLIETLPPILILHLKRFKFGNDGTSKVGKKVGYPLELQLPAEVFSKRRRNALIAEGAGFPKYRLIGVVYHHGKHANGGHYTVDVRRQDEQEWIRLDDTVIRRVRSEDVAEAGAEETKETAQQGVSSRDASTNRFGAINDDDEGDGWKEVTPSSKGGDKSEKKWSAVANGNGAPKSTQSLKDNIKDNKVAYLLFYQRI